MKNILLFLMINFLLISCQKDDITWKIKRLSPKDAKLEVAEIIYSNNCSSLSGFKFNATGTGTPSSIYWDLANNGYKDNCFKTQGNCTNASVTFNLNTPNQGILRFYFKATGMPNENANVPSVKINSTSINTAIILGHLDAGSEWLQIQTEIIKAGNNAVEIKFSGNIIKSFYIDQIELWAPLNQS